MLALIFSLVVGWLLLRWMWPREPLTLEPPAPQLVVHLHLIVPLKEHPRP